MIKMRRYLCVWKMNATSVRIIHLQQKTHLICLHLQFHSRIRVYTIGTKVKHRVSFHHFFFQFHIPANISSTTNKITPFISCWIGR